MIQGKTRRVALKQLLRGVLLPLLRLVRMLVTISVVPASQQPLSPHHPRLLLIRSGHLGDLVLATPALHALKAHAPESSMTLVVAEAPGEIVARHPAVDHV